MAKILGPALKNIPWEDRPAGCSEVVWRSSLNPIVPRNAIPCANSIFNSAVVPYEGKFAGVFRVDDRRREMRIHSAFSEDGIHWNIDPEPFHLVKENEEFEDFVYGYDPRCCKIGEDYVVTWCNCFHGPTIGVATTKDFKTYYQKENAFLPYNRNGVMFPRKIGGNYAMLSRPSDTGHTAFGDIFYSESPDLVFWGKHRHVMAPTGGWQSTKIGAGPIPIETDEGWLLFYHGVLTSCNGYVYAFGATLLDRANALFASDYAFRDIYLLTAAAEEDDQVPARAESGLTGWIDCFEKARLAGTVFAGGVNGPGETAGHPALERARAMGRQV